MANVVINLSESVDAKSLEDKDIVHQSQFKEAKKWIDSGIKKVIADKQSKGEKKKEHHHEAITILGTRGSGKTTFLLSLLKYYETKDRVSVLDIIDPTLMEEKGHIFLNIISIINDLVQKKLEKSEVDSRNADISTSDISRRVSWNNQLLELSHGLPSMDGVGGALTSTDWQDPEYIMERGIRAVSAARELAQRFQDFVKTALEILDKDLFILAFDDIDIDFKKGWPVLETIRKYLLTSRIITNMEAITRFESETLGTTKY